MEISKLASWLVGLLAATIVISNMLFGCYMEANGLGEEELNHEPVKEPPTKAHIRKKRLLWITTDGRLALPPGTQLTITPSLSLPFVRYPPDGFLSNMSISLPFSIDFDRLGLTDNQNPYGVLPPILGRSLGRQAGSYFADYVAQFLDRKRTARSAPQPLPKSLQFHGGERALLYTVVEDLLSSFGMDGKACLLRAICEVHSHKSIQQFGLVGEIMQLFFTASKSRFAKLLEDYVTAEITGKETGECWPYFKECPKSLFRTSHNKYSEENNEHPEEEEIEENEIKVDDDDDDSDFQNKKSEIPEFSTLTIKSPTRNDLAM